MCGDPTITTMGLEKPYAGRLRFSAQNFFRSEELGGANQNQTTIRENQLALSTSYSFSPSLTFAVTAPLVWKDLRADNGARTSVMGMGDLALQSRILLLDNDYNSGKDLFGILAGIQLPVAATKNTSSGEPLGIQSGSGAVTPQAGVWYGHFSFPWSIYANAAVQTPVRHRDYSKPGTAVLHSLMVQYQINSSLALQLAEESRWSARDEEFGETDVNSGGWITFLSPKLAWGFYKDMLLNIAVQIPTISNLNGAHTEGYSIQGGLVYDFF